MKSFADICKALNVVDPEKNELKTKESSDNSQPLQPLPYGHFGESLPSKIVSFKDTAAKKPLALEDMEHASLFEETIPPSTENIISNNSPLLVQNLTDQELTERIELSIDSLNEERLREVFAQAKFAFATEFHENQMVMFSFGLLLTPLTFGLSALVPALPSIARFMKAEMREPDQEHIRNLGVVDVLYRFLTGDGDVNKESLKFFVVNKITNISTHHDHLVKKLVEEFEAILFFKMSAEQKLQHIVDNNESEVGLNSLRTRRI